MKKKFVIMAMGLALVLSACANTAVDTVSDNEDKVEASTDVSEAAASVEEKAAEETTSDTDAAESTSSTTEISSDTNESSKSEASVEAASEASSKVDAASTGATTVKTAASSGSAKTSGQNSSLMAKFPVIDYPANGTGRGPGANFRKGHDYENHEVAGGKVLGELN